MIANRRRQVLRRNPVDVLLSPLSPIGDIASGGMTESIISETIAWQGRSDWLAGTQSSTQANQGTSDIQDDKLNLLINGTSGISNLFGAQENTGGMGQYPAGDGGNGSVFVVSDGNSNLIEYDKSGNQLQSATTASGGPRDAAYFAPTDTLWQSGDDSEFIYSWNPDDLSQGNSSQSVPGSGSTAGIASDNTTYLWVHVGGNIYKVEESDPATEVASFGTPTGTVADSDGSLGWNGQFLLYREAGTVYILDPDDGTQIDSFSVSSNGKHSGITRAYGEWWASDRNGADVETGPYTYASSGTHTTTTKTFNNQGKPDLNDLQYSLNGESITLDVVGSPGTASEEVVTQTLDGANSYSLSWSSGHTDFRVRVDFSTATASTTPTVTKIGLATS